MTLPVTLHKTGGPQFKHDCDGCTFLGRVVFEGSILHPQYDLYVHWDAEQKNVVVRYGSDDSDYYSGLGFIGQNTEFSYALEVALTQAIDAGIIPRHVGYPIALRDKWLRPPEKLDELEPLLHKELARFEYEVITDSTFGGMRDAVYQLWNRMLAQAWVDGDIPAFSLGPSNWDPSCVAFAWEDRRVAAQSTKDYITVDRATELVLDAAPDILCYDLSKGLFNVQS